MKRWFIFAVSAMLTLVAQAAPMTLKELQFLLRQRTPESEVLAEVTKRKLTSALTAEDVQSLKQMGATDGLIQALSGPSVTLTAEEATAEARRQSNAQAGIAHSMAEDAKAYSTLEKNRRQAPEVSAVKGKGVEQLDGTLVRLNGDQLTPVSVRDLAKVRVFGFYYSASWCGPCRQFTPVLVKEYQRLKARYGDEFEIIFVSQDRSEAGMKEYMRTDHMPWPAVRYGTKSSLLGGVVGDSIPWLVAVNSVGEPMTRNGIDKKFISPNAVLGAIEKLLESGAH